jgi:ribosomal protein S18 acetylase RimI-like enzyme
MVGVGRWSYLRACTPADDAFLYDVFATTWESEVAALPNQNLARHVLRIQHIAQERRFGKRFAGYQRFVVLDDEGVPAGRLYVCDTVSTMHVVDLTLLPQFQERGIGTRILRDLIGEVGRTGQRLDLRVARSNERAMDLYARLGLELVDADHVDHTFSWDPSRHGPLADVDLDVDSGRVSDLR